MQLQKDLWTLQCIYAYYEKLIPGKRAIVCYHNYFVIVQKDNELIGSTRFSTAASVYKINVRTYICARIPHTPAIHVSRMY